MTATTSNLGTRLGQRTVPRIRRLAPAAAEVLRRPGSFSPGSPELRAKLDERWTAFVSIGETWKRHMTAGGGGSRHRFDAREQRWLWKALLPFHERLPTISVFLVDYPVPVVMAIPPTTCLIAPGSRSGEYARQVLAGATRLGESTMQHPPGTSE